MGGRAGKIFTAETAEGAEMIGANDLPELSLRSLRAYSMNLDRPLQMALWQKNAQAYII